MVSAPAFTSACSNVCVARRLRDCVAFGAACKGSRARPGAFGELNGVLIFDNDVVCLAAREPLDGGEWGVWLAGGGRHIDDGIPGAQAVVVECDGVGAAVHVRQ